MEGHGSSMYFNIFTLFVFVLSVYLLLSVVCVRVPVGVLRAVRCGSLQTDNHRRRRAKGKRHECSVY